MSIKDVPLSSVGQDRGILTMYIVFSSLQANDRMVPWNKEQQLPTTLLSFHCVLLHCKLIPCFIIQVLNILSILELVRAYTSMFTPCYLTPLSQKRNFLTRMNSCSTVIKSLALKDAYATSPGQESNFLTKQLVHQPIIAVDVQPC
jgi:hypothetical protein